MSLTLLSDTTWYPVLFDSPKNAVGSIFFWIVVALAVVFALYVLFLKGDTRKAFLRASIFVGIAVACTIGLTMLVLSLIEDGVKEILFYPLLVLIAAVGASAILIYHKNSKTNRIVAGCISGAALIAVLVCTGIHFASGDAAEDNWITNADVNTLGLYLSAVLAIAAVIAAAFFFGRKDKKGFDAKSVSFAAVCIAMSFALSYLRIVKMPQGGSITVASLLPLMIYSYMFGTKKGVFAGFIYGLLQALQDSYILHPAQFILDYPAAFACIGLAGMFAKTKALEKVPQVQLALGGIVAGVCRYLMHFLSGIFAFGAFAPEGTPVWLYSLTYQAAYVLPDIAIAIVVGVLVFSSRALVKQVRKYNPTEHSGDHAEKAAA